MRNVNSSLLTFVLLCLGLVVGCGCDKPSGASLTSISKNKTHRVMIIERSYGPRRFEIWIEDLIKGTKTNIYSSSYEDQAVDNERIVWRDDHSQFVFISRNLRVRQTPVIRLESMYLLFDIATGKTWCNSVEGTYPSFSETNLFAWRGSYENDEWRVGSNSEGPKLP